MEAATPTDPKVLHVLNRLSLGARPGEVQQVEKLGVDRYIQQQLSPESLPEPGALTTKLAQLESLRLSQVELFQNFRLLVGQAQKSQKTNPAVQELKQMGKQNARMIVLEAVQARLLRATESPRQLQEGMVDFWFNHFNVFSGKGLTRAWVGAYEQEAIRPHAMGRFRDLLGATARHPAMLFYLDNWQNSVAVQPEIGAATGAVPVSPIARRRSQGLNENYARELMELHTLGVNGGYTQQDVISLAKIFTGWGFRRPGQQTPEGNVFYFDEKRHDFSDKVFLGRTIKGSGIQEVEQALDILAKHPATARHVSYKLAQYFVADQPPKALVDRMAQRFQATDGNIREVLSTLFRSPEFFDRKYYNAKFKTPYQYVVSVYRARGLEPSNPQFVQNTLQQLGMPLYGCPTPNGYKNTQEAWLNPDAMTRRLSFATTIATRRGIGNREWGVVANTLGNRFSAQTRQAIAASPPQLRAALILGSPEFMKR